MQNYWPPGQPDLDRDLNIFPHMAMIDQSMPQNQNQQPQLSDPNIHVKRPLNAFIVFSKSERAKKTISGDAMAISKEVGARWKALSEEEKAPYYQEAKRQKQEFEEKHPDYKFHPKKKSKEPKETAKKRKLKLMLERAMGGEQIVDPLIKKQRPDQPEVSGNLPSTSGTANGQMQMPLGVNGISMFQQFYNQQNPIVKNEPLNQPGPSRHVGNLPSISKIFKNEQVHGAPMLQPFYNQQNPIVKNEPLNQPGPSRHVGNLPSISKIFNSGASNQVKIAPDNSKIPTGQMSLGADEIPILQQFYNQQSPVVKNEPLDQPGVSHHVGNIPNNSRIANFQKFYHQQNPLIKKEPMKQPEQPEIQLARHVGDLPGTSGIANGQMQMPLGANGISMFQPFYHQQNPMIKNEPLNQPGVPQHVGIIPNNIRMQMFQQFYNQQPNLHYFPHFQAAPFFHQFQHRPYSTESATSSSSNESPATSKSTTPIIQKDGQIQYQNHGNDANYESL